MKKKIGISLIAVIFVAIAVMGTVAYFSKSFTSDNNTATAASFEVEAVNSEGTTIGDAQFNLDGKLYPGMKPVEVYSFSINKNNTEVPVQYKVNLNPSGNLFPADGTTPIKLTLQRNMNGDWTDIDYQTEFKPEADVESFKIFAEWPHGENDIAFQGMTGNIKLEVVATQIVDEEEPGEPEPEPEDPNAEKSTAQITLYKDSTSSTNFIDFTNITNFKLKNKQTRREYTVGTTPSNQKYNYKMSDIPVGEYTIHFDAPAGVSVKEIQIGDSYKETIYHADTNPFVISKRANGLSNYVKIVLKSELTLKEIKPLEDLTVPANITYNDFLAALPKKATIVDSGNQEHQVDLKWDVRPLNFDNYKKPGTTTLWSEFFKLPVSVSNSDPAQRLEVTLKVNFQ
ncbi:hypothetical protein V7122_10915 [Bacillus sp. JJ1532]|uniref:hypothetical protein n=1 Tax=Bacillus sp. JJ1532 TaxID=3122958 RepID=UPI002FFD61E2